MSVLLERLEARKTLGMNSLVSHELMLREAIREIERLQTELAAVKDELAKDNEDETCRLCGFQPAACHCKHPTQGEGSDGRPR